MECLQIGSWKLQSVLRAANKAFDNKPERKYLHYTEIVGSSSGINVPFKTHPLALRHGYLNGIHSEFSGALRLSSFNALEGATLINVVLKNRASGRTVGCSAPCEKCQEFLTRFKVRQVIFTNGESWGVWTPSTKIQFQNTKISFPVCNQYSY